MSAIEERIGKLLALADSPNENEAAAAAEKAQALMRPETPRPISPPALTTPSP